tara:strand:+ start:597 stop:812 length:216 start_codon:yes stop_codon:yes gene_type:complete
MNTKTETFISYLLDFYGPGGIYDIGVTRDDILLALGIRLARNAMLPFQGDSIDREMVRDIILEAKPQLETI